MKRFQLYLPDPMLKRLAEIAEARGYSVAEVIRSMVQKQLDADAQSKKEPK